jgi:two-component system, OmpR family, heavy metal sensor histidine kinase CusS
MSWTNTERPAPSIQGSTRGAKPWSLAARLTTWYALSAFVLVSAVTVALYWGLKSNLTNQEDAYLSLRIQVLRSLLRDRPSDAASLNWVVESKPLGRNSSGNFARVINDSGNEVAEAPGMDDFLPPQVFPQPVPVDKEPVDGQDVVSPRGKTFRAMAALAQVGSHGTETRIIQVSIDRTRDEEVLAQFRREFALVLAITLLVSVLGGQYIARRGTKTIKAMGITTGRIRNTNLQERLNLAGLPSELVELAASFNAMMDRLEESFTRLSQFSADLAHELRTPLNNLRGEAEVALGRSRPGEEYREILESSLEEFAKLSRIVDSLLFLARAESPSSQLEKRLVNVKEELEKMREFYQPAADEKKIGLILNCYQPLFVEVDRALFQRALGNLVENALAHTPSHGEVHLVASREGKQVRIDVADTGEGIAPEHLPHIFDRFYRADQAQSAKSARVGLGLAIVKSAATMQGGTVDISSQVGKGTRVSLRLPIAAAATR